VTPALQKLQIRTIPPAKTLDITVGSTCARATDMETIDLVESVTERVIRCAIAVHTALGPGLLESMYRDCLLIEMKEAGLVVETERMVTLEYKGQRIGRHLKIDLLVQGCVIVELKAVDRLHPVHLAQVITYLKLADCPAGLLMNFNVTSLRAGLRRLKHPDLYSRKAEPVSAVHHPLETP
jgi:GxxExxY protein